MEKIFDTEPMEMCNSEEVAEFLVKNCPFEHKELSCVLLGGSRSNNSFGRQSDLDIVTIMQPQNPDILELEPIQTLGQQLKEVCVNIHSQTQVAPVVISTIRLEEAQIEIARLFNPGKEILPIHWLHYPSIKFLVTNEPPELAKGLLAGNVIKGVKPIIADEAFASQAKSIAGLDWLTDSLRILMANSPTCFPDGFLKKHACHNLHYFWKWKIIAAKVQQLTGLTSGDWHQIEPVARRELPDLMVTFDKVHEARHQGELASTAEIINLHNLTFTLWPNII